MSDGEPGGKGGRIEDEPMVCRFRRVRVKLLRRGLVTCQWKERFWVKLGGFSIAIHSDSVSGLKRRERGVVV